MKKLREMKVFFLHVSTVLWA